MHSLTLRSASSAQARSSEPEKATSLSVPLSRYIVFFAIAASGCAADLLSKEWIFRWRGYPSPVWWLFEPYVGIETAINTGALFGVGSGWGRVFAGLSVAAAFAIPVWLFYFRAASSAWLTIALSCVMAGILGNLYDRLGLWVEPGMPDAWNSAVRDWILFRWRDERWTWPNFNIADSLLVCGAVMLMWQALREESTKSKISPPDKAASAAT